MRSKKELKSLEKIKHILNLIGVDTSVNCHEDLVFDLSGTCHNQDYYLEAKYRYIDRNSFVIYRNCGGFILETKKYESLKKIKNSYYANYFDLGDEEIIAIWPLKYIDSKYRIREKEMVKTTEFEAREKLIKSVMYLTIEEAKHLYVRGRTDDEFIQITCYNDYREKNKTKK